MRLALLKFKLPGKFEWGVVPAAGLIDVGQEVGIFIQQIFTYYTPDTRQEQLIGKASALISTYLL